ncbi:MAG TPA: hypothetical protein DEG17_22260 [Cyanobacteria bacterium UBA11149]|nr:hypothetical protein [Cyanobacteria bacterium UBA11366]HBK64743.1 hypothetical protein [Cyanobacteria bacterium UBA11166]HBR76719.1 hypothetical protein [Cyanobacteria bacterium UBA11159]HBW91506.1 hypothetical protein [Cyanobacteria bacterium UBA11149]HCA94623.1 hypothetical protein [Cyanobacteria bacterium UBA9226]
MIPEDSGSKLDEYNSIWRISLFSIDLLIYLTRLPDLMKSQQIVDQELYYIVIALRAGVFTY